MSKNCLGIVLVFTIVTLASTASAQVAYVNSGSGQDINNDNSYTLGFTAGATSNFVMVATYTADSAGGAYPNIDTTACTYAGVAMTPLAGSEQQIEWTTAGPTYNRVRVELWYRVNPPTGASNITMTVASNVYRKVIGAVSFSGVNTANPIGDMDGTTGTGTSTNLTLSTWVGSMIFDTLGIGDDNTAGPTTGGTERWQQTSNSDTPDTASNGQTRPGTGYNVTSGWTWTGSDPFVQSAVVILPPNTAPVLTNTGGNPTIECNGGIVYTLADAISGITVTDTQEPGLTFTGGGGTSGTLGGATPPFSTPGVYVITYDIVDSGGLSATQITRTVTVQDTAAPVITLNGSDPMYVECGASFSDPGATAADACEGDLTASIVVGGDTVDPNTPGTYNITYDVSDSVPLAATQETRTVYVQDTTPPVITLNGSDPMYVECTASFSDPGATAADACEGDLTASIVVGGDTVDPNTPGTYVITYDVSDSVPNAATQETRTVYVQDTTDPVVTITGGNTLDWECGVALSLPGATASDTCDAGVTTAAVSDLDGLDTGDPAVGVYNVEYAATDASSNTGTDILVVTITDTIAPVITVNGADPLDWECGIAWTDPGATAADSCEGDLSGSIVVGGDTVDVNTPGTYNITYDVSDSSANPAVQETRTVNVQDTTAPVITLIGGDPLDWECGAAWVDPGVTALDACEGDLGGSVVIGGDTVDVNNLGGVYVITYDVSDSVPLAATQVTRTVNIVDNTPPVVTITGGTTMDGECTQAIVLPGATAADSCDPTVATASVTDLDGLDVDNPAVGVYNVVYSSEPDSESNVGTDILVVTITDTIAPVITVTGADPLNWECGATWVDPGATADDTCEGDLTASIVVGGDTVDGNTPGTYTITYDVSDSSLNPAAQETRTVNVQDTTGPVIALNGADPLDWECGVAWSDPGATATDTCEGDVSGSIVIGGDTVDVNTPGVYVITYDAQDSVPNAATQETRTVNVVDTTPPVVTITGGNTLDGECGVALSLPAATAADTCDATVATADVSDLAGLDPDNPAVGIYNVVYSSEPDAGSNVGTDVLVVTITDTTGPVITLNGTDPIDHDCGTPFVDPGAVANDACEGDLSGSIIVGGDVIDETTTIGSYTITYDVTDGSLNPAAQVPRVVNVADLSGPIITPIGGDPLYHECKTPFSDPGATADDPCEGDVSGSVTVVDADYIDEYTPPGTYYITYEAEDSLHHVTQYVRAVEVVDTTDPIVTINSGNTLDGECGEPLTLPEYPDVWSIDDCDAAVMYAYPTDLNGLDVNNPAAGVYNVVYTSDADFGSNTGTAVLEVTITDTKGPVITLNGKADTYVQVHTVYNENGAVAMDACEGDVSSSILIGGDTVDVDTEGVYSVTYNAWDSGMRPAVQVVRTVNVVNDTEAPEITLQEPGTVQVNCGQGYVEPGYSAWDNLNGDITEDVVVSGGPLAVNTPPGIYTLYYDVQDGVGNPAVQKSRVVEILDNCPLAVNIVGDPTPNVAIGGNITLEVEITGAIGAPEIQWYFDNGSKAAVPLTGENEVTLELTDLQEEDAGDYYTEVSDDVTTVVSPSIALTVGKQVPLGGIFGLSILTVCTAFGGAASLRRRKR